MNRIRQLASEGQSIRQIARLMHISKNTVKKYLNTEYDPNGSRGVKPSNLDEYKPFIDRQVANGNFNCENILA